jgi:hypothetical protein
MAPRRGSPTPPVTTAGIAAFQLRELADLRVEEARALLGLGFFSGAAYLVGYGVELHIKAVIAVRRHGGRWPTAAAAAELHHHDLELLLSQAGLSQALRAARKRDANLEDSWRLISRWTPSLRYARVRESLARDLVEAVANERCGVARWLRQR